MARWLRWEASKTSNDAIRQALANVLAGRARLLNYAQVEPEQEEAEPGRSARW